MQKREEHQISLEKKIEIWIKEYQSCTIHSSIQAKYTSVKQDGKVLFTIYYRSEAIRVYLKNDDNNKKCYHELKNTNKIYLKKSAWEEEPNGSTFSFFAPIEHEEYVIKYLLKQIAV